MNNFEKLWRDRLAYNLHNFRRVKGRWPDKQIMEAVKASIKIAVEGGYKPPYLH